MKISVLKETRSGEKRVALSPAVVQAFIKAGHSLQIEDGAGLESAFTNEAFQKAGGTIADGPSLYAADLFLAVNPPEKNKIMQMPEGSALISFLYASQNQELVESLKSRRISAFAMEDVPRISRAQSMDALSSQANLAGYKAVITGAEHLTRIFPLMMTAAGTITPTKVLIFGAGVAGLQAIATAKRLGAVVEVSDVRPETKEQVESLGGKYIEVKAENAVQVVGGYAQEVSAEFLAKQREAVEKSLFQADLIITTALVRGGKAPILITAEQVGKMKFGSVIVDMAVEQGGNCALSKPNEIVEQNGVKIIGATNLPSTLATNASELYAKNIQNLFQHLADVSGFKWELDEEITKGCLAIHHSKSE